MAAGHRFRLRLEMARLGKIVRRGPYDVEREPSQIKATAQLSDAYDQYGNDSSWGLTYNLYADKLLGLNLFPSSIYDQRLCFHHLFLSSSDVLP